MTTMMIMVVLMMITAVDGFLGLGQRESHSTRQDLTME